MTSAKEIWERRVAKEQKPKGADGGLGHDELRDRWLELYPNIASAVASGGGMRRVGGKPSRIWLLRLRLWMCLKGPATRV